MKIRTLLILSIVANLILGYQLISKDGTADQGEPSAQAASSSKAKPASNLPPSLADETPKVAVVDPQEPEPDEQPQIFGWENIESDDFLTYMDNLRKIGCPEETIQDIIKADVEKLFKQRRRDFEASLPPIEYWKVGAYGVGYTPEQLDGLKEIQKEKEQVLKTLLGSSYTASSSNTMMEVMTDPSAVYKRQLGFLDEGKRQAVVDAIMGMQEDMINAAAEDSSGAMTQELVVKAMKARDEALSQILTPEEKFEFDLRVSESASALKNQLNGMDLTEQEFRDMYALQKKIYSENEVDPYAMWSSNVSDNQKRSQAEQEFQTELKSILGEERHVEYQMSRDWQFQELNRVAQSNGADRSAAVEAYNIQNQAQEAMRNLNSQAGLTDDSRQQAVQQILDETNAALQQTLGDDAFKNYQDTSAYHNFKARYGMNPQPVAVESLDVPIEQ